MIRVSSVDFTWSLLEKIVDSHCPVKYWLLNAAPSSIHQSGRAMRLCRLFGWYYLAGERLDLAIGPSDWVATIKVVKLYVPKRLRLRENSRTWRPGAWKTQNMYPSERQGLFSQEDSTKNWALTVLFVFDVVWRFVWVWSLAPSAKCTTNKKWKSKRKITSIFHTPLAFANRIMFWCRFRCFSESSTYCALSFTGFPHELHTTTRAKLTCKQ